MMTSPTEIELRQRIKEIVREEYHKVRKAIEQEWEDEAYRTGDFGTGKVVYVYAKPEKDSNG